MKGFFCCMLAGLCLLLAACGDRNIDDRAGLMHADELARLRGFQTRLLQELDIELQIVVLDVSPADLDREAVSQFEKRRIGARTKGARGVLLLIDPNGREVRMEIGYDLEGIFTDALVGYVEQNQMAPFFAAGRVGAGIEATVELLVGKAMGAIEEGDFLPRDNAGNLQNLSGGGGARSHVRIGHGLPAKPKFDNPSAFMAQPSPELAMQAYLQILRGAVKDPELGLYTPETRSFYRTWLVTDAQQDNERRLLEAHLGQGRLFQHDGLAVLRFPVSVRSMPPYFLRQGEEGWMLDFAAMNALIAFNHRNQWHFRTLEHPFMFAFEDWHFDGQGFPHPAP
jgi:uncharacterized protein